MIEQRKLQNLLKELFRIDASNLNFGIYKIMKQKADEINNFIEKDLIEYIQSKSSELKKIENIEADIYKFFKRYYDNGDFLSKRRYSQNTKYVIPYNGEEVYLHWANNDQYYIKTSEDFSNYSFESNKYDTLVNFKVENTSMEKNNNKSNDNKYFILKDKDFFEYNQAKKEVNIYFEYRALREEEEKKYKSRNTQRDIRKYIVKDIEAIIKKNQIQSLYWLTNKAKNSSQTVLAKHINKYTKKNKLDYFIHKDLQGFLERELDFYIKNEIIDFDVIELEHENELKERVLKADLIKSISKKIIDFLAQIEDFQKKLFEKKKFVLASEYCLTLDRIPEKIQDYVFEEIINNHKQLQEFQDVFNEKVEGKDDLLKKEGLKKLVIDTKHFDKKFKEKLLSSFDSLDDKLDGILIKSESYQALSLLLNKYQKQIQAIYIDPPFNTGGNEFLYKNNYLDSSWITMMNDRLKLGRKLLKDIGNIAVRIDSNGNHYVRMLMDRIFNNNFKNEIAVRRTQKAFAGANRFITANDSLFFYSNSDNSILNPVKRKREQQKWINMHSPGVRWSEVPKEYVEYYDESQIKKEKGKILSKGRVYNEKVFMPPEGRHWTFTQGRMEKYDSEGRIRVKNGGLQYQTSPMQTVDSDWTDIPGYVVPSRWGFSTENSEKLLKRVIEGFSNKGDYVLDYFLGSGTTVAVAHKLQRKWIGVEMGDYFDSITLQRMKEVIAGRGKNEPCGISKKVTWNGGGFFKYQVIEQYEDTLNNIKFNKDIQQLDLINEFDDYLINYMLDYETKKSLIDIEKFTSPFEYKLKVEKNKEKFNKKINLVETFNYLISLNTEQIKLFNHQSRKYKIIIGTNGNQKILVIWRDFDRLNLAKERDFIENTIINDQEFDKIYINVDSYLDNFSLIEEQFAKLLFV
ncbi:site-specific DNA-methyltransferase [Fuchsiella alkaliacetigena]|uniref:site-specific DNA-methyltransferase n=1 Tax=Fuchsiella alkaliacetigena TaxID=957042 RepID=UPI002009F9F8|nr:site-specific DNA-methyltransferase [Fuchsiella alkaliacetigena]MCK8825195.1 site-specific DNA-methyltransferase [Fuchsiella alkaliacetigena]